MNSDSNDGGFKSALKQSDIELQKAAGPVGKGGSSEEVRRSNRPDGWRCPQEVVETNGRKLKPGDAIFIPGIGLYRISPNGGLILPAVVPGLVGSLGASANTREASD